MIRFAVPPIGGKGWFGGWMYMGNLIRTMAEHGDPDIETVLFVGPDRADDPLVVGLRDLQRTRVVVDPAFSEDRVRGGLARTVATGRNAPLLDAFARERIDVAFTPAIYLGWRSPIRSIAWFPDFQHRRLPHLFAKRAWWRRELGFRAQVAASSIVMLSSEDAANDARTFYPATRGKTRVARFAVPMRDWPDAETAARTVAEAGIARPYLFLPNQFWMHKNHGIAIEAMALMAGDAHARPMIVTGKGHEPRHPDYPEQLAARVRALGVEGRFRMIGAVDHLLVKSLMICADALVNPSRFEGWSTTVEEAKACGTPLILSDLPVHREQAAGYDARFFAPDDAAGLAAAMRDLPPRAPESIGLQLSTARAASSDREAMFGRTLSALVREAVGDSNLKGPHRGRPIEKV